MDRSLIVARIKPGAEPDVARIFAASDATGLPRTIGVRERSLYTLGELYVHVVEFDRSVEEAMAVAQQLAGFREISRQLDPFVSAYDPSTWRSPKDAMARRFYHWEP
jgi:cyclase